MTAEDMTMTPHTTLDASAADLRGGDREQHQ